jgi:hypothetical protein
MKCKYAMWSFRAITTSTIPTVISLILEELVLSLELQRPVSRGNPWKSDRESQVRNA